MKACCAAVLLGMLGALGAAQDASPPGNARAALEAVAAKGDAKATASALARRGGDWFDVVLSVVADPMPPLEPTKALVAALPDPERKALLAEIDAIAGSPAEARRSFANAAGALTALMRTFGDPRSDSKTVADAVTLALDHVRAAGHPWITARGAVAKAIQGFEGGLAEHEPELQAAADALSARGDRFGAALVSAFHAKALGDRGDLEKAVATREIAQKRFKELGTIEKGGAAIRSILARVDLALAGPLLEDARDDLAAECCARARQVFKTSDPMRDLVAAAVEASILIGRGNPAAALEATKSHVARIDQIKDKAVLTRLCTAVATALRMTGKAPAGIEFLRRAVGRAKELGMTPDEESPLRAAMALTYMQAQQYEPAHAALEVVAKFADEPHLRPLAKTALLNRAVLFQAQGRPEQVDKALERAAAIKLPGPTLERVAMAGPDLAIADLLVDQGKPKEALKYIHEAASVAEELGLRMEDVRLTTLAISSSSQTPLHLRVAAALGNYSAGADWAGFEPVFLVTERSLQEALVRGAPEEKCPADLQDRLIESDRQVLMLRRAASGARAPLTEEDARRITAFRRAVIDEAWSRAPTFALRRFPRAGSIKRARENFCGVDGAVFGASVTAQGAYAYAFSRDRFMFFAVPLLVKLHDSVAAFAALAKDPKCAPSAWVAASTPLWENLIAKTQSVFEDKQWLAVCPDPVIDTIPIEALVPGDARSDQWRTLPYLVQKIAVGRCPTTSLAPAPRSRKTAWTADPFVAIIVADKPESGLPLARAFDPAVAAPALRSERAGVFRLGESSEGGTDSAPAKRPRYLVFGHGIQSAAIGWSRPTPSVVCVLEPPPSKEGANDVFRWLIGGVRGVIAPKGPIDRPLADALIAGALKSFAEDGGNPIEALSVAKRSLLSSSTKTPLPGVTEMHHHPVQWTQLQAWLVNP